MKSDLESHAAACHRLLALNAERVQHFVVRMRERGDAYADVVIVIVDVDEPSGFGADLADALMPGHDWQQYRDRGETPIARGLASLDGISALLERIAPTVHAQLRLISAAAPAVIVFTDGGCAVYAVHEADMDARTRAN